MLCFAIAYLTLLAVTGCCIWRAIRHAPTDTELLGRGNGLTCLWCETVAAPSDWFRRAASASASSLYNSFISAMGM